MKRDDTDPKALRALRAEALAVIDDRGRGRIMVPCATVLALLDRLEAAERLVDDYAERGELKARAETAETMVERLRDSRGGSDHA
jgi:RPA family protein